MIAIVLALALGLSHFAKRSMTEAQQIKLARIMAVMMAVAVVTWVLFRMWEGLFDYKTDLPFDV